VIYRIIQRKEKYIYAKCKHKHCNSYFHYLLIEDVFKLTKFNDVHCHSFSERRRIYKSIEDEINELPLPTSISTAKMHICQKYRINQSSFYYLFKKIRNRKISYIELIDELMEKKFDVQSDPFFYGMNELPNLIIIVTPLMRENAITFGQWMGFDMTYNLVQEKNDEGR
jgi:hypothetical protein